MTTESDNDPSIDEALAALSDADIARLYKLSRLRAYALHDIDDKELLHMAIERALSGRRPWPPGVPLIAFLAEVMRSIADDYLKREQRHVDDEPIIDDRAHLNPGQQNSTPEGLHYAKYALEAVDKHFEDDEEAWLVVNAWAEGYTGKELETHTGLTDKQYEAAAKRIRRNLPNLLRELKHD